MLSKYQNEIEKSKNHSLTFISVFTRNWSKMWQVLILKTKYGHNSLTSNSSKMSAVTWELIYIRSKKFILENLKFVHVYKDYHNLKFLLMRMNFKKSVSTFKGWWQPKCNLPILKQTGEQYVDVYYKICIPALFREIFDPNQRIVRHPRLTSSLIKHVLVTSQL